MTGQPPPPSPYGEPVDPEPYVPPYGTALPESPGYGQAPYPQHPYAQPGGHQPYGYGQQHGGATTSMVLGIVGLTTLLLGCCFSLLAVVSIGLGVAAIVVSTKARREIDASGGRFTNRGSAVAGQVTGIVAVCLGGLVLVFGLLTFGLFFLGG